MKVTLKDLDKAIKGLEKAKVPQPRWILINEKVWNKFCGRDRNKLIPRIKLFYARFKNQRRIHKHWASLWTIIRMAWSQSKYKYLTYTHENTKQN